MNMEAIKAVLEALKGKCYEDMADEKSSPEDKMAQASADAEDQQDGGIDDEEEKLEGEGDKVVDDGQGDQEPDEEDDFKNFFKSKKPAPTRPGTAVMIAIDKKPVPKKSMKDLMHG